MTKRIATIGGGPGGLFFATLMKRHRPDWTVTLFERNQASDAFGFGVVFSDATLTAINAADPVLSDGLTRFGVHWDRIDVRLKGETVSFCGNGMAAIHRKTLLHLLQEAARDAGVELRFGEFVTPDDLGDYDVVVAADGANSAFRERMIGDLGHHVETAEAKFIWFGTTTIFDGLTFLHQQNEHGNFAVHAYPISDEVSTFIVETDEETWRAAGLDEFDVTQPPGPSDEKTRAYLTELFSAELAGGTLLTNNSRWANFRTRRTERWHSGKTAFLGDAVHTAHFSVGSGTKMAMEDAIVLARELSERPDDLTAAFEAYEGERVPKVARIQNAAGPSLRWWENFGDYYDAFEPWQFGFHFFSRSIPLSKIRVRDPEFAELAEQGWAKRHGSTVLATPLTVGEETVLGRALTWGGDGELIHEASGTRLSSDEAFVLDATAPQPVPESAGLVIVTGGSENERIAAAEAVSIKPGLTVLVELAGLEPDLAETIILSGRASAVIAR
ncbi:FAD-dependent monooxygenase [Herbiconiux sp. 11R-BC]|uniref:FAD-dependent monooxygenase n=1 Tax=Herbiconiux sp. 11R-BC TaxID=3111637 RepID=UPI003C0B7D98